MMEEPAMPGSKTSEGQPSEGHFWEGPYPTVQALLTRDKNLEVMRSKEDEQVQREINRRNELVEKIEKMAKRLKEDGYSFELTDDKSEYALRVKGLKGIIHITKVDDPMNVDIKRIIFNRITNPSKESI